MKILDGVSVGEVLGIFNYHLLIWDVDNNRAAEYTYSGIINTVGFPPFTECGETDWSRVFTIDSFVQVNQLSGKGSHTSGSIAITSAMSYTFLTFDDATVKISGQGKERYHFGGSCQVARCRIREERGRKLIPGSVRVFSGP
jgi:hypothetical protein